MLKSLSVSNFALVEQLEVGFGGGLTVVTGESGAGKSILLGALGLVLGERATTGVIRPGATRADVSAEFDLTGLDDARSYLAEQALDDPDDANRALVRRVVGSDGRSRAYLNGTPVTLGVLRRLTEGLIDIHAQDDNQRLTDVSVQRALLDSYGVDAAELTACRDAWRAWQDARARRSSLERSVRSQEDRATLLAYQLEEIERAAPAEGEFEEVVSAHKRINQSQTLKAAAMDALASLENATADDHARSALARLDDPHPALDSARQTLTTIGDLRDDAIRDLRTFEASLEHDPELLDGLDARLAELHELARKHKVDPAELPALASRLSSELEALVTDRDSLTGLEAEVAALEAAWRGHAERVRQQRRASAETFCAAVSTHMKTLGIRGGALAIEFGERESEHGFDTVEFLCITNPRYPAAPLAKVASGGERTRISLSIQIVAAERCQLPSLILDEADVGVGGTTADVIGRLLRGLADHGQVICITHAPQIAALGEHHLLVAKDSEQDTRIEALAGQERVEELARMLAGAEITSESRNYAKTLLADGRR